MCLSKGVNDSDEVLHVVNQDISHLGWGHIGSDDGLHDGFLMAEPWNKAVKNDHFTSSSFTHREFIGGPKNGMLCSLNFFKIWCQSSKPMHCGSAVLRQGLHQRTMRLDWMPAAQEESYCFRNRGEIWTGSEGSNLKEKRRRKEKWDLEEKNDL